MSAWKIFKHGGSFFSGQAQDLPGLPPIAAKGAEVDADLTVHLQANLDAFGAQLDELLARYRGKYVLFADAKFVQVCDSYEQALETGYTRFGRQPFLLQRVEPIPA